MSEPPPRSLSHVLRSTPASALAAVSIGGAIGALARYGLTVAFPHSTFDVATLVANVIGGFLIGALMVLITEFYPGSRLVRPFFGVGVLGGFTTFSAYIVDIGRAANAGETFIAVAFAFTTLASALLAAAVGMYTVRRLHTRRGGTE